MTRVILLLLAQSGISFPPFGFVSGTDNRLYPLYGVQGNVMLGDALPADVASAAYLGSMEIWKLPGELRFGEESMKTGEGTAIFARHNESDTLFAYVPSSGELIQKTTHQLKKKQLPLAGEVIAIGCDSNALILFARTERGLEQRRFHPSTMAEIAEPEILQADFAAVDSKGNRWQSTGRLVQCREHTWRMDDAVTQMTALDNEWMLVQTAETRRMARCESTWTEVPAQ